MCSLLCKFLTVLRKVGSYLYPNKKQPCDQFPQSSLQKSYSYTLFKSLSPSSLTRTLFPVQIRICLRMSLSMIRPWQQILPILRRRSELPRGHLVVACIPNTAILRYSLVLFSISSIHSSPNFQDCSGDGAYLVERIINTPIELAPNLLTRSVDCCRNALHALGTTRSRALST